MTSHSSLFLDAAWIDPAVRSAHPDYAALLVTAHGLAPGPSSDTSEAALRDAELFARLLLDQREPHDLPEVQEWRAAFQGFGVKPREARSSVESLLRRAAPGLPRIDRLTDVYNAVSVLHLTPLGGEDLTGYVGPPRLVVSTGDETFDTLANGQPEVVRADAGEIVWRDDVGITCRRWNWRQCVRTRLTLATTEALFIVDALGADARDRAEASASDLTYRLAADSPDATFATRTLD